MESTPEPPEPPEEPCPRPPKNPQEPPGERRPRTKTRLACGFGCPCCGPLPAPGPGAAPPGGGIAAWSRAGNSRSLVAHSTFVDGDRGAPYVDSHVHLEMVLQKLRWYEAAPSLQELVWEGLSKEERVCWKTLGWGPWQNLVARGRQSRSGSPTWFVGWASLSGAERGAAEALGWDSEKWDGYNWLLPTDQTWNELDEETRRHLAVLGEDQGSWNEMFFGSRKPAGYVFGGDMRTWDQLTTTERRAAAQLGFGRQTWDMVEMAGVHEFVRDFCGSGFEGCITQGCDGQSLDECLSVVRAHPRVFCSLGCHPKNAWLYEEENLEERLIAAFDEVGEKAVAWGEFGLDFSLEHWAEDPEYRSTQVQVFERQVQLALERRLPLVLHIREAADEALALLRKWVPRDWKAHIHSFHGPSEFVEEVLQLFPNFFFGITGTASMGEDGDGARMVRVVPLERMVLETNGPYMIPTGSSFHHPGHIPLISRPF
ncbi:unnamed protein product [Prorocentrum cordatum]|uniref:Uncharacterized protein n=1 Tax=Prorocentrum cordatum TaxID=2364126 RepID=A0ABN9PFK8_9DINO|nr:unnamed protein product [Polarella glacialis]